MKKLLGFLLGLLLIWVIFAMIYFSGVLYDATDNRHIEPVIFQPNDLSRDRVRRPVPLDNLSASYICDNLMKKFVMEYFYITPDVENIATRTRGNSVLAALSSRDVFRNWQNKTAIEIERLASRKVLRRVIITDEIVKMPNSDYWDVYYELQTWDAPNNLDAAPNVSRGVLHLKTVCERGVREVRGGNTFDIAQYLSDGGDPAAIFKFRVDEIRE